MGVILSSLGSQGVSWDHYGIPWGTPGIPYTLPEAYLGLPGVYGVILGYPWETPRSTRGHFGVPLRTPG